MWKMLWISARSRHVIMFHSRSFRVSLMSIRILDLISTGPTFLEILNDMLLNQVLTKNVSSVMWYTAIISISWRKSFKIISRFFFNDFIETKWIGIERYTFFFHSFLLCFSTSNNQFRMELDKRSNSI